MARKRTTDKPTRSTKSAKPARPAAKPKAAPTKAEKEKTIFRVNITLNLFKPPIWRRIETPDCTLEDLHYIIQACMPWGGFHLWEFTAGQHRFGPEMEDDGFGPGFDDDEITPADQVRLSDLTAAGVKKLRYMYDFGDSWEHTIALEKPVAREPKAKYPRCIAGERAGPPEDCGGVWGYANLLEIQANPEHPEYGERMAWLGGPIDPEAFSLEKTNRRLP